ncbi:MAG: hypothetical protein FWB92_02795 [Oscillospiraceae bacterium]|nr:hypothetical protein [Oscillospiraceae bacterium]
MPNILSDAKMVAIWNALNSDNYSNEKYTTENISAIAEEYGLTYDELMSKIISSRCESNPQYVFTHKKVLQVHAVLQMVRNSLHRLRFDSTCEMFVFDELRGYDNDWNAGSFCLTIQPIKQKKPIEFMQLYQHEGFYKIEKNSKIEVRANDRTQIIYQHNKADCLSVLDEQLKALETWANDLSEVNLKAFHFIGLYDDDFPVLHDDE